MVETNENKPEEIMMNGLQKVEFIDNEHPGEIEERFWNDDTKEWEGTGNWIKIKEEDPDDYRDNEENR